MKKLVSATFIIVLLTLTLFIFNSCKQKGCTDKSALNYNSVADKNDGSCVYCTTASIIVDSATVFLFDQNSNSDFFEQAVAEFTFRQESLKYNDENCGADRCDIRLSITSLVSKKMDLGYAIQSFSQVQISGVTGLVSINAGQTIDMGKLDSTRVSNPCGFLSGNDINLNANSQIVYH